MEMDIKHVLELHAKWLALDPDGQYADLMGADLWGVNLMGADLRGVNLMDAHLRDADLRDANLRGADLRGADLRGANLNWQSHSLLAEILRLAAGDSTDRRMIAGLIAVSTDWCWDKFMAIEHPEKAWAISELAKWVRDGDWAPHVICAARAAGGE